MSAAEVTAEVKAPASPAIPYSQKPHLTPERRAYIAERVEWSSTKLAEAMMVDVGTVSAWRKRVAYESKIKRKVLDLARGDAPLPADLRDALWRKLYPEVKAMVQQAMAEMAECERGEGGEG